MNHLTSNWNVIHNNRFSAKMHKRGIGRMESKLEDISRVNHYQPTGVTPHVACVRSRGKGKYEIIGGGFGFIGKFDELKSHLRQIGYTGVRMGAIKARL